MPENHVSHLDRPIVLVDIETMGTDPYQHDIIDFAFLRFDPRTLEPLNTITSMRVLPLHPECFEDAALAVNGYNALDWESGHSLQEALELFVQQTKGDSFASWNLLFDWPFVLHALHTTGVRHQLHYSGYCAKTAAMTALRDVQLPSYKLVDVCRYLGIEPEPVPHEARHGVERAHLVLQKVLKPLSANAVV